MTGDRRLITVRGTRVRSGADQAGWVRLGELIDGWVVFPDPTAAARRWQRAAVAGIVLLAGAEWLAGRVGWRWLAYAAPMGIVLLILLLITGGEVADDRRLLAGRRARADAALRAGGVRARRQAVRYRGRARTVGEMNILLSSIGRTDPVFSTRSVRELRRDRRWWQTTVRIELTNGRRITYRVRGLCGPAKLARILDPARFPHRPP